MNTLNISDLQMRIAFDFLDWAIENKIGNWKNLDDPYYRVVQAQSVIFEFSDEEATLIQLRWS